MPDLVLAAVNPDNTPHGYNWTFAFPMLLFIVIAVILYALYSRPHRRVPSRPIQTASASGRAARTPAGGATPSGGATMTASTNPAETAGPQPAAPEPDDSTGTSE